MARQMERVADGTVKKPKRKPKVLGHITTRLEIGPWRCPFMVHDDLLCTNSNYFKSELQPNRKTIDDDSSCAICLETMDAARNEVEFCMTCGQNLHKECMQDWLERNESCPSCRNTFMTSWRLQTLQFLDIDAELFDVYFQWLYTDSLILRLDETADNVTFFKKLAQIHDFGQKMQDIRFSQAVACECISACTIEGSFIDIQGTVDGIYDNTNADCTLRKLIVDLSYVAGKGVDFNGDFPVDFLRDFAKNYFEQRPGTMQELCEKYCGDFKQGDID